MFAGGRLILRRALPRNRSRTVVFAVGGFFVIRRGGRLVARLDDGQFDRRFMTHC